MLERLGRSPLWIVLFLGVGFAGGVAAFGPEPDIPRWLNLPGALLLLIGGAGTPISIIGYWQRFNGQTIEGQGLFRIEPGGRFLFRHFHGPRNDVDIYRIDAATKEKIFATLVRHYNAYTARLALLILLLCGILSLAATSHGTTLMAAGAGGAAALFILFLFSIISRKILVPRATHRLRELLKIAGTPVPYMQWEALTGPPSTPQQAPVSGLPLFTIMALILMMAGVLIAFFFFAGE
ncbi:MAG TPA: hypothetical protein VKT70_06255 [Stellaceae bacterium]|nr:hypothetical protein [Stellaceae bacterium]